MTSAGVPYRTGRLPSNRDLALEYAFSLVVAVIMAVASVVGLLYSTTLYPTEVLVLSYLPSDAFNLVIGLPFLLGSLWLARRGKLVGLLCWPGALFYVLYMYIPYVVGVPFNVLFLAYLLLVVLSAYTLIGLVASVASIDGEAVRQRLSGFVPARTSGGILAGLAIFIVLRQTALIVTALISQASHDSLEIPSWIADFAVVPMLLISGIQLWRRRPLGYVTGGGLLLAYGILALGLIPFFGLQARYTGSPIDLAGIGAVLIMAALCFVPFAFFVRGATSRPPSQL
jgi:hypothetical protein